MKRLEIGRKRRRFALGLRAEADFFRKLRDGLSTTGVGRTVFDDGDVDTLSGENGRDWLIAGPNDLTKDLAGSEIRTAL